MRLSRAAALLAVIGIIIGTGTPCGAQVPGGGLYPFGAITPGDCAEWYGPWQLEDAGGACGGSGGGNANFGTATGNTANDVVTMSNTTVGVKDSGIAGASLGTFATATGNTANDAVCMSNTTVGVKDCGSALGTAAAQSIGTSGSTLCLLNANCTFGGTDNFTGTFEIGGTAQTFPGSGLIAGTTDTQTLTNKSIAGSEINSGVVGQSYGGAGTITGALKGNGSGTVSQAACADLSNAASGCSSTNGPIAAVEYVIDGGGSAITTGVKGFIEVPFACTINRVTLIADQTGSIVVDIWSKAYASNSPPTVTNTITASDLPTLSSAQTYQDSTLTGWTTSIAAGNIIGYNVNSATTVTRVTVSMKCTKS
jgi:hypothetical protein